MVIVECFVLRNKGGEERRGWRFEGKSKELRKAEKRCSSSLPWPEDRRSGQGKGCRRKRAGREVSWVERERTSSRVNLAGTASG